MRHSLGDGDLIRRSLGGGDFPREAILLFFLVFCSFSKIRFNSSYRAVAGEGGYPREATTRFFTSLIRVNSCLLCGIRFFSYSSGVIRGQSVFSKIRLQYKIRRSLEGGFPRMATGAYGAAGGAYRTIPGRLAKSAGRWEPRARSGAPGADEGPKTINPNRCLGTSKPFSHPPLSFSLQPSTFTLQPFPSGFNLPPSNL